jgi:hypothetical protein
MLVGDREADGDLAVLLLAELAAVLPRHADGVLALLGEASVVDDPGLDRPVLLDGGQHASAHHGEHGRVGPIGLGDQVVQRLMGGLDPPRLDARGHRLNALALARQQQACAVAPSRGDAVGMAEGRAKRLDIG